MYSLINECFEDCSGYKIINATMNIEKALNLYILQFICLVNEMIVYSNENSFML